MIDYYLLNLIEFMQKGGLILYVIFFICIILWFFLLRKYLYIKFEYRKYKEKILQNLIKEKYEKKFISFIKDYILAKINLNLNKNTFFIKILIIICPLIGLLGTVTGMIEVFDVLATKSSNDIKLMASGISMATIPTMAGMAVALSGILFEKKLNELTKDNMHEFYIELSRILK